jgi:hypothetical protein
MALGAVPARAGEVVLERDAEATVRSVQRRFALIGQPQWSAPRATLRLFEGADAGLINEDLPALRRKYVDDPSVVIVYDYWGEDYGALYGAWEAGERAMAFEEVLCEISDASLIVGPNEDFVLRMWAQSLAPVLPACQIVGGVGNAHALVTRLRAGNRSLVAAVSSDENAMRAVRATSLVLLSLAPGLALLSLTAYALSVLRAGANKLTGSLKLVLCFNAALSTFLALLLLLAGGWLGFLIESGQPRIKVASGTMMLGSASSVDVVLISVIRSTRRGDVRRAGVTRLAMLGFLALASLDAAQITSAVLQRPNFFWYTAILPFAGIALEGLTSLTLLYQCSLLHAGLRFGGVRIGSRLHSFQRRIVIAGYITGFASAVLFACVVIYSFLGIVTTTRRWLLLGSCTVYSRCLLTFGQILFTDPKGAWFFAPPTAVAPANSLATTRAALSS